MHEKPVGDYNGRGVTTGTIFGKALADLMTGADESALPIPVTDVVPESFRTLKTGFFHTAFAANQLWKSL